MEASQPLQEPPAAACVAEALASAVSGLPSLAHLHVQGELAIGAICAGPCARTITFLAMCGMSDADVAQLPDLPMLQALVFVEVAQELQMPAADAAVTDASVPVLAELAAVGRLSSVSGWRATDVTARALQAAPGLAAISRDKLRNSD
jgi:hypothetical protein